MKVCSLGLFLLLIIPHLSILHCKTRLKTKYNFPYLIAKRIVTKLSRFKPKTDDPIKEIELFARKLLKKTGLYALINGKSTTNFAPIPYKVQLKFPTFEETKFYFLYASAINCEGKLEDWSCYYCQLIGNNVQLIDYQYSFYYGSKSYVAINHDRKEIVLCYQATTDLGDLLNDLRAVPAIPEDEEMEIKVHRGFRDATRAHFFRDTKMIKELVQKHPNYKIVIAGHSLGAGMAAVALFMIKYMNLFPQTETEYYGYGTTRVGNKEFIDYFNQLNITAVRAVFGFDFFVHLPPASLGYYHFQNEMWVRDSGNGGNVKITLCRQDIYEDPDCVNTIGLSPVTTFPPIVKSLMDHIMYFNIDPGKCYFERPLDFFSRLIWPLINYWPPAIYNKFPNFTIQNEIFSEIRQFSYTGVKEIYKIASKPETYYDPKYEYKLNKIVP